MNNKPVARTSSSLALAVAIALSQSVFSNIAQADSVRKWGYWDASTAAGPSGGGDAGFSNMTVQNFNTSQNNSGSNIPSDQKIVGINNGQFLSADTSGYVGYTICTYNCNTNIAGKINFDVTQGSERNESSHYEAPIYYWSDGKPYYIQDTSYYNAKLVVKGTYDGAAFNLSDSAAYLQNDTTTYYWGYSYSNSNVSSETEDTYFQANLSNTSSYNGDENYSSPVIGGNIYSNNSYGGFYGGKPISASQIAEQMRLGQTYNFSGYSYNGSNVQIAVNFQNATWNGTWGASYNNMMPMMSSETSITSHNGFTASGGISGSTLASNSITGSGVAGVGYVTGGKVDATLVGVIKGTDASAAAVIGRTSITVQQAIGTKTVGDVFSAGSNLGCKGGCN